VSSANKRLKERSLSPISLMYTRNNRGLRTDPWGPQQTHTHMRTMNLCLLLFGVYNIDNFQTILVNSLLFHSNSFCASNFCAKLYRKPLRNHKKTKQHSSFFSREFKLVLYSSINWCTEECLGKKPDWYW
jgi:hypothetical protein